MAQSGLRIGEVAERAGVSIDTLRYYERRRLLARAARTIGGFRIFTPETIERVRFIKQAQDFGFSLEEIGTLLKTEGGAGDCRTVRDLLKTKLTELDKRLVKIKKFRGVLTHYLSVCESELRKHGEAAACPVMVEITGLNHSPKNVGNSKERKK